MVQYVNDPNNSRLIYSLSSARVYLFRTLPASPQTRMHNNNANDIHIHVCVCDASFVFGVVNIIENSFALVETRGGRKKNIQRRVSSPFRATVTYHDFLSPMIHLRCASLLAPRIVITSHCVYTYIIDTLCDRSCNR